LEAVEASIFSLGQDEIIIEGLPISLIAFGAILRQQAFLLWHVERHLGVSGLVPPMLLRISSTLGRWLTYTVGVSISLQV
jgi:hypothetical protein